MNGNRSILVEDGKVYLIKVRNESGEVVEVWPARDTLTFDKETGMYIHQTERGDFYLLSDDVEVIYPR